MKIKITIMVVLISICILTILTYRYLTEPINYIDIAEDIKNYELGAGIVSVELNYQGNVNVDIDEYWNMEKFDNGLPITAWKHYWLTDELIENFKKTYINFPSIDTSDKMIVISLGRKIERLYYYKESGYINLSSVIAYIGEPVFSKDYYEDTIFIYTSPTYISFPYYEFTDDNIRFNKYGDIPYEVRPYTKRTTDDGSILMRPETRLDIILKKIKGKY